MQPRRFDNPMYYSDEFSSGGGYVLAEDIDTAEEKLKKHFDVGLGRLTFVDMNLNTDNLKALIESEDNVSWNFFYGSK